ncbi:MAG: peptidase M16 [Sphingomonadales bacterium 32-64-17]|nr:MAG: peptidase M16 [Sphingomonadales bacterium 32-64-17]
MTCPAYRARLLATLTSALALSLAITAPAAAQAPEYAAEAPVAAAADPWPFATSDLPKDPAYRTGVLANGMRYIIRPNATPPKQGLVQLWVDFGSAAETDEQQGWAHYIEHMAFNGSTHLPEGEMVKLLEREGLAFGADTNASTGFDTTLYRLDLPRNDTALLDTALMLMRETASELTFDEEAVERERGIILSEISVRDTYQQRSAKDSLAFSYPGSAMAQRFPGGLPETVSAATGAKLKALWDRFYRPDNVALIVVGDYDADTVEAMIRERFADWQAEPPVPAATMGPVDFDLAGKSDIYLDPALAQRITVSRHGPWLGGPDTEEARRIRLRRAIGYDIINRRLERLTRLEDPPFRAAGLSTSDVGKEGRTTSLTVYAISGAWERGLEAAQEEYRRALTYGFTEAEVAEQLANYRAAIAANAAGAATRPNSTFVTGAVTLLRDGQVPTTPESALERFTAHAPEITPDTVLAALREEVVPLDDPLIRYEGEAAPDGGAGALRTVWNEGTEREVSAPADEALTEFAYQDFGTPGEVVKDAQVPELGIREITFANGVMLNLKRTDLQADRVLLRLNLDGGDLLNTRENPLATGLASFLPQGGLGKHSYDELLSILAGRNVSLGFASDEARFQMAAGTTPEDLELQLELFAAALSDPGFRSAGEAQSRQNVRAFFARRSATPAAALGFERGRIISDGDPRFSYQDEDAYLGMTFDQLRASIADRLDHGAIELTIVGDINEDRAIALVSRTLGALPQREASFRPYTENLSRSFTQDRSPRVVYHDGPADQASLTMIWPTTDDKDHDTNLRLELLQRVARIALTDSLREELGQTYSPSANAEQSRTYPGYGTFSFSASLSAAHVDEAREAMLETLAKLRDGAIDEDLLLRARQPMLEAYDNLLDTNNGWLQIADEVQSEPWRTERFLTGRDKIAALTPADLTATAERFLVPDKRLEIAVMPRPAGQP